MVLNEKFLGINRAFEKSVYLIEDSVKRIEEWENDTEKLEEILRSNHRGWEIFFKAFILLHNQQYHKIHYLTELITKMDELNLLPHIETQNLEKLFRREISFNYYEMLDNLFADTNSRYAELNAIEGKISHFYVVDSWIKKYAWLKGMLDYNAIRSSLAEINNINLRYFAIYFTTSDPERRFFASAFHNSYKY